MSEEQIEWRDAWKKLIDASREMILNGKKDDTSPFDKLTSLQDDKMLLFEKAIAFECLGNKDRAIELYKAAADENNGLPVAHWRKRAKYFFERLENNECHNYSKLDVEQGIECVQLDLYYNLHSFCFLDDYIRYLAISSVSRVCLESAMSIVIFRTCLEIGLWTYFEKDADAINVLFKKQKNINEDDYQIDLKSLIYQLHCRGCFDERENRNEYDIYKNVKNDGNKAAHPGKIKEGIPPFKYSNEELITVLDNFNKAMFCLNKRAKETYDKGLKFSDNLI